MIWNRLQLRSIVGLLRALFFPKFLPKLARHTLCLFGTCMGRVIRCHKEIVTKRLQQKVRRFGGCKHKAGGSKGKCSCSKCIGYKAIQRKRVMDSGFLANLAYNHRVYNANGPSRNRRVEDIDRKFVAGNEKNAGRELCKDTCSDIKDVYIFIFVLYALLTCFAHLVLKFIIRFEYA